MRKRLGRMQRAYLPTFRLRGWRRDLLLVAGFPIAVIAHFIGGETLLLACALLLPMIWIGLLVTNPAPDFEGDDIDRLTGLPLPAALIRRTRAWLLALDNKRHASACFQIELDEFDTFEQRQGHIAADHVQRLVAERLLAGLRGEDLLARSGMGSFIIMLHPVRHIDLEMCIQLASRMQSAIEEAMPLDATSVHVSCSIGFCLSERAPGQAAEDLLDAAGFALREALRHGPSAIRAYSEEMQREEQQRTRMNVRVGEALENGEIRAWFQPQVSTDSGKVTGFEALARWEHPERGVIPPGEFLETLAETGQLERLTDLMLREALRALCEWDEAGLDVPMVGVNFAGDELRNPMLIDKIRWELDRFDLTPNRLAVEVLETVIAGPEDGIISRNINGLAKLGCHIDLDDFGTGHASISSIRRFAVSRLKIDRSFVMKVDADPEQQRMVSAIVTMAERLDLTTIAEGVEGAGEHHMLSQLGCAHVQGYGIARPMPFDKTLTWMREHNAKLQNPPEIGRKTG